MVEVVLSLLLIMKDSGSLTCLLSIQVGSVGELAGSGAHARLDDVSFANRTLHHLPLPTSSPCQQTLGMLS